FGERWRKILRAYGIDPRYHGQEWGERLDPAAIATLAEGCSAVYVTHSETSTGVVHDVRAIAEALRPTGAALVVDAVSSLGGVEGAEAAWARNRELARAARAGARGLGLDLFSPDDDSSSMVTAVLMPDGIDGQEVYRLLRDRFGVVLAGGQGPLRGRIVRIGH